MSRAGTLTDIEEKTEPEGALQTGLDLPAVFDRDPRVLFFKNADGIDTVYPYNLTSGVWERAVQLSGQSPRGQFIELMEATTLQFGDVGLTGGTAKGGLGVERTFVVLRRSLKLEPMPSMLQGRYLHAAVELFGEIYAIAGLNGKGRMNACEKFKYISDPDDPEEARRWQTIAPLNITRSKLCACALDYKTIYVFGGEQFPSLERYSVSRDEWELLPPINETDPSFILSTIGLHRSGPDELLILGRFFAFTYNARTQTVQREAMDSDVSLEKSAQNGANIIVFTKNQPQLCMMVQTQPFRVDGRMSSLNTQYGVDLTTNVCAVSRLDY